MVYIYVVCVLSVLVAKAFIISLFIINYFTMIAKNINLMILPQLTASKKNTG